MTKDDIDVFAKAIEILGETYSSPVSKVRMLSYFETLARFDIADVLRAMREVKDTHHFATLPTPGNIIAAMGVSIDDRATLAWEHVVRQVKRIGYNNPEPVWPDAASRAAARGLFGNWEELCRNLPAAGPEFLGHKHTFRDLYLAHAKQGSQAPGRVLTAGGVQPAISGANVAQRAIEAAPLSRHEAATILADIKAKVLRPRGAEAGTPPANDTRAQIEAWRRSQERELTAEDSAAALKTAFDKGLHTKGMA